MSAIASAGDSQREAGISHRVLLSQLAPVLAVSGLSAISLGIYSVALPLYALSLGATPSEWGFIVSVGIASLFIFEPTWGIVSDRTGVRFLLISTRFVLAAISVIFVFQPGLGALYILQFVRQSFEAPLWPLAKAHIGAVVPRAAKGTYLGLFYGCLGIGQAVGAVVAGYAVAGSGYQLAFLLCVASTLVASLSSFAIGRRPSLASIPRAQSLGSSPDAADLVVPQRASYVWPFAVVSMLTVFAFAGWSGANNFLPVVANESLGLPADQVGLLVTLSNLGNAFLMVPAGMIADWKGRKPTIISGLLVNGVALIGFAVASSFWTLALPVLALSGGRPLIQSARVALLSDLMPPNRQGMVMGLIGAIEDMGVILGTAGGGLIWQLSGRDTAFQVLMIYQLLAILVCLALLKEREWVKRVSRVVA